MSVGPLQNGRKVRIRVGGSGDDKIHQQGNMRIGRRTRSGCRITGSGRRIGTVVTTHRTLQFQRLVVESAGEATPGERLLQRSRNTKENRGSQSEQNKVKKRRKTISVSFVRCFFSFC
jgi:hypothetical protein